MHTRGAIASNNNELCEKIIPANRNFTETVHSILYKC